MSLLVAGVVAVAQSVDNAPSTSAPAAPSASPTDAAAPGAADSNPAAKPADGEPAQAAPAPAVTAPTTASAPLLKPSDFAPPPAALAPPAAPVTASAPAAAAAVSAPALVPAPVMTTPALLPPAKPAIVEKADNKDEPIPAKKLFSAEKLPSLGKAMAIGYYPRGCLQGGVALPVTGATWQVMRISRNRNWGHPDLIRFLEKFAPAAAKATGWHGILIGDMAQPRGGPLPFGHMSHQIGLDVDIWFMPMPDHVLTNAEREKTSAINLVTADWKHINPKTWTPRHYDFIRTAAEQPGVERVLVNAAIKKEMCHMQGTKHPAWMDKVRPWYGHNDHIHVRLECPADSPNCRKQPPVPDDDGCGKSLDYWFSDKVLHPKPRPANAKPPRPITLADLPPACKTVLASPDKPIE